jgi:hypothetical protein
MGFGERTITEETQDAALKYALRLHENGHTVLAVGTETVPGIFHSSDIPRLFAQHRRYGLRSLAGIR